MMDTITTVVLCSFLLSIGIWRLAHIPPRPSVAWWAYTQTFLLAALAKLARTPDVADRFGEPALAHLTDANNGMTLIGMTLGAMVAVPAVVLMSDLTGRTPSMLWAILAQATIAVGMVLTFSFSDIPAAGPSSYITATVPMPWNPSTWAYWGIFLGSIGIAGLVNLVLALHAYSVVRRGTFAGALLGWAATAGAACLYIANKIVNLIAQQDAAGTIPTGWYLRHVETISLVLILTVVAAFVATLAIYPVQRLPHRWRRYRMLRRGVDAWNRARIEHPDSVLPDLAVPTSNRRDLWRAARDPLSSYSLQVELADTAGDYTPSDVR